MEGRGSTGHRASREFDRKKSGKGMGMLARKCDSKGSGLEDRPFKEGELEVQGDGSGEVEEGELEGPIICGGPPL